MTRPASPNSRTTKNTGVSGGVQAGFEIAGTRFDAGVLAIRTACSNGKPVNVGVSAVLAVA